MKHNHLVSALMLAGVVGIAYFPGSAAAGNSETAAAPEAPAVAAPVPAPVAVPAATPAPATASPWSANVSIVSQYVSRGLRQTWGGASDPGRD